MAVPLSFPQRLSLARVQKIEHPPTGRLCHSPFVPNVVRSISNEAQVLADLSELGYDLDDLREGRVLAVVMKPCPECGDLVGAKWTPDGSEPVTGCESHN